MASLSLNVSETLNTAESLAVPVARVLAIAEAFSTSEALTQGYGLNIAESCQVFEEFRRGANGVISDMILSTTPLTAAIFANALDSGHAPGFEDFRDFVQGNYDYSTAAFRVILESITSDRASLSALKASADVPDITDGGEITITTAITGADVLFSRTFNTAPDYVNLTVKGGAIITLAPEYGSVTKTGMNVKLYDSTHTPQTGTISWAVKGH